MPVLVVRIPAEILQQREVILLQPEVGFGIDLKVARDLPFRLLVAALHVIRGAQVRVDAVVGFKLLEHGFQQPGRFLRLTEANVSASKVIPPGGIVVAPVL
jgi:hypothetical protein